MQGAVGLGQSSVVTVGVTATLLVGPSESRYALVLFPANGGRYTVSSKSSVTLDQGPTVVATSSPTVLTLNDSGTFLQGEIWAIASASVPVGFIECLKG